MPERDDIRNVGTYGDQIRVRFTTRRGQTTVYTAQYEVLIEGRHRPAVRYDSAHGRPHCDVLDWDGETIEKVWLPHEDFGRALSDAIREIEEQWSTFRAAFLRRRS